ncbi:hypothetical protein [Niallia circulans]|nr:hypothetical protein [Niallia circulans]
MKTKKESRKGTSGVHSVDESQKGGLGREKGVHSVDENGNVNYFV